jgi:hypothetical protein
MLRPRDSHDLRLIRTNLSFSPSASVRWIHDVFGNSIAIASFGEPAAQLRIESRLQLETYVVERPRSEMPQRRRAIRSSIRGTIASILATCWSATIPTRPIGWALGRAPSCAAVGRTRWRCSPTSTPASRRIDLLSNQSRETERDADPG